MDWNLSWDDRAYQDLDELDVAIAERIVKKVSSYLICDPMSLGKTLSGNLSGMYSYRFGNYRVIYRIILSDKHVVIRHIGHRRDVYDI